MKTTGQSLHYTGGCTPSDVNSNPWKREKEGGKEGKRKREGRREREREREGGERERKESFQGIKLQNTKETGKIVLALPINTVSVSQYVRVHLIKPG